MFNLYKSSEECEGSIENDEELGEEVVGTANHEEENDSIDDQIRKVCKFRIRLCQRTKNGRLASISESVDTDYIEESLCIYSV